MKKKLLLAILSLLLIWGVTSEANAQGTQVSLEVKKVDDKPVLPDIPRTPILFPTVWQDGYELEIEAPHAEYVLNIVSGTTVVYSIVVPETVSLVVLPATLSGTYELQLIQGNLCFYGDIDL